MPIVKLQLKNHSFIKPKQRLRVEMNAPSNFIQQSFEYKIKQPKGITDAIFLRFLF